MRRADGCAVRCDQETVERSGLCNPIEQTIDDVLVRRRLDDTRRRRTGDDQRHDFSAAARIERVDESADLVVRAREGRTYIIALDERAVFEVGERGRLRDEGVRLVQESGDPDAKGRFRVHGCPSP